MPTFRDLLPAVRPPEELAPPRRTRIHGETVEEAIARGVPVQVIPIVRRDHHCRSHQFDMDHAVSRRSRRRTPRCD